MALRLSYRLIDVRLQPARALCTMRKVEGSPEDAFFRKQQRAQLDALKKLKPAIDEKDENVRLAKILDTVVATDGTKGVREEIREALKVQLLLVVDLVSKSHWAYHLLHLGVPAVLEVALS